MNLNDVLAREIVRNTVNLTRFEAGLRKTALAELIRLDNILVGILAQSGPNIKVSKMLATAKQEINKHIDSAKKTALRDSERLTRATAAATAKSVNLVTGSNLATSLVSDSFVKASLKKAVVMGAPAAEMWGRQKVSYYNRFADIARAGFITGKSTGSIITDWNQNSDQLRRNVESQVRTSVHSMANAAQMQFYENNGDFIDGVQVQVTLDLRTSPICRARSGMAWSLDGKPINASASGQPYPGHPPYHYNCRSIMIGVLKEFSDLNPSDQRKIPVGTQASMNGQVPANLTYDDWFKTLPESDQVEVLGQSKFKIWKDGRLSHRNMINQDGNTLTIEQLESR